VGIAKKLAPKFETVGALLSAEGIAVGKVDCIAEESLYWSNNIKGYPTIIAFVGGAPIPYDGPREVPDLVTFMKFLRAPVVIDVEGVEDFVRNHRTATKPVVVLFLENPSSSFAISTVRSYDLVCKQLDSFTCGVKYGGGEASPATSSLGYTLWPAAGEESVRESFSEETFVMMPVKPGNGAPSDTELRSWILGHAYPAVVDFNEENMDLMFSDKRPGFQNHVLLFIDKTSKETELVLDAFRQRSPVFTSRCIFITVDVSAEHMNEFTQNLLSDLDVGAHQTPLVMIIKSASTRIEFYSMRGSVTGDAVESFVKQFFDSAIEPEKVIEVPK